MRLLQGGKELQLDLETLWIRYDYRRTLIRSVIYLLVLVLIGFCIHFLKIDLYRLLAACGNLGEILYRYYRRPDIRYIQTGSFIHSLQETIKMALLGGGIGISFSVPIAWFAAYNMTPSRRILYPVGRFVIIIARSVPAMIWAVLFVSFLGFGPLAGTFSIVLMTIGFTGKLFSEEIEAIDKSKTEAIKATGANLVQVMTHGVFPQVKTQWALISIYSIDSAVRSATILGFFGAGGMGWHLREATETLSYSKTAAILLVIILLGIASEAISARIRKSAQGGESERFLR